MEYNRMEEWSLSVLGLSDSLLAAGRIGAQ